jgi:hypothetical protein
LTLHPLFHSSYSNDCSFRHSLFQSSTQSLGFLSCSFSSAVLSHHMSYQAALKSLNAIFHLASFSYTCCLLYCENEMMHLNRSLNYESRWCLTCCCLICYLMKFMKYWYLTYSLYLLSHLMLNSFYINPERYLHLNDYKKKVLIYFPNKLLSICFWGFPFQFLSSSSFCFLRTH